LNIQYVSLFLIVFAVSVIIFGIAKIHMLPGQIAVARGHPQAKAIEICSLLGLLVFPFWMFALLWAYGGVIGVPLPERDAAATPPTAAEPAAAEAE
jgi:hypothetical protein